MFTYASRSAGRAFLVLALGGQPHAVFAQMPDLHTLSIAQSEQLLQARNRELRAARRAVEAAQAGSLSAGAPPNPILSLGVAGINPSAGIGAGPPRDKTVDSTIRIDQVLEGGDRRQLRVATAQRLESASGADLSDVYRQQRVVLRSAYYELLFAQNKAGILQDNAALFESSTRAAELRLKAGDIASADVSRLRVDALRAANDARAADADRRRAQLSLAYLIGAEAQAAEIRATDPWPDVVTLDAEAATDGLIDQRPDVRAAKSRLEAAESARQLARSLRTRDVTVGAQFEHYPVGTGTNTFGTGNSYGVFLSVPLFARYQFEGEIQRAEVDYTAAMETLEKVRALARAELARAFSDLQSTGERLKRYDEALLPEAAKAAESAEFAYKNGAIGVMDLLDSRRTQRAIQIDAASARNDYSKALSVWLAGMGRLD
jgi:cobalt-zinc-cadmium efflux system outer membrane protein